MNAGFAVTCRAGGRGLRRGAVTILAFLAFGAPLYAQHAPHAQSGWTFMQDGVVFVMFNDQGSPRGEREVKAPNWWMGMAQRRIKSGTLTLDAMLSLDSATVSTPCYRPLLTRYEHN